MCLIGHLPFLFLLFQHFLYLDSTRLQQTDSEPVLPSLPKGCNHCHTDVLDSLVRTRDATFIPKHAPMHPRPPITHPTHPHTHNATSSGASSSLFFFFFFLFHPPFPKRENQKIYAHQGLMGTVTDGANDMCPSRGSTLVLARLVTYAQSQGHQRSRQPPVSARDTPVTPLLQRHNDRDRP